MTASNDSTDRDGPLVFGVAGSTVAEALRQAGLGEDAVVAILGRAVARSAAIPPDATAPFVFQVEIEERAPDCALTYQRAFVHPDFIDGESRVQGGMTPEELGFNARFHAIEAEFDAVSHDLLTASSCVAELRRELFRLARELESKITQIDARLNTKAGKESKEGKDTKEGKETTKDGKETKESKEGKETTKDGKETKETKEAKEAAKDSEKATAKEVKEFDKLAKEADKATKEFDKATAKEAMESAALRSSSSMAWPTAAPAGSPVGRVRTFIAAEDRPDVQAAALRDDQEAESGPADDADRTEQAKGEAPASEPPETPPS